MKVLDHGYVNLIDSWGSDEAIIEAARMSTGKGFLGWTSHHSTCVSLLTEANAPPLLCDCGAAQKPGDEKLLAYLYKHKHMTPFEMAGMVIEVKAPIFVFREWHRHRTQSYNEMSARYIPLPDEDYFPSMERIQEGAAMAATNRQAQGAAPLADWDTLNTWRCQLLDVYKAAQQAYEFGLSLGVPKELARLSVPVARYSKMRASANLRNWLAFLTLRLDPTAQWEIRQYAIAVGQLIALKFPRTWNLFKETK